VRPGPSPNNQDLSHGVAALPDDELLRRLTELVGRSRRVECEIVAHIAEVDQRRLYAREATPSMFAYCTEVLRLSEQEAYLRITVARATRAHPMLLEMLADGRLHLSGIAKLAPHISPANRDALLARAVLKSKRQIEELVAELAPAPDAPALIRKLPERRGPQPAAAEPSPATAEPLELGPDRVPGSAAHVSPPRRPTIQPTAPARYRVQFTATAEFRAKIDRLAALMRHAVPDGDLAAVLEAAVTEKLARLEAKRFGKTKAPRKTIDEADTSAGPRHIQAPVRRFVDERDEGRCRYVGPDGRRCSARVGLQFHHHLLPHGRGGDRSPENVRLMCRTHNILLAEQDYGPERMAKYRRANARVAARRRPPGAVRRD
jgi:hypothetical protein